MWKKVFLIDDFLNKEVLDKSNFLLNKDELHLWFFKPPRISNDDLFSILSFEEQNRARLFLFEHHKVFFSYCYSYLRILISQYNCCDPSEVKFARGTNGKPYLCPKSQTLKFNMSHSGDGLLLGFSRDYDVGVDLERINYNLDWRELAEEVLTVNEQDAVLAHEYDEQVKIFYAIWTLKEAYLKGTGEGITHSLKNIEFLGPFSSEQEFIRICHGAGKSKAWFLNAINIFSNYSAAVASGNKPSVIKSYIFGSFEQDPPLGL